MTNYLIEQWKKNSLKDFQQGRILDVISDISWQVNLLALISVLGVIAGLSSHFFSIKTNEDITKIIFSIIGFGVVVTLNVLRKSNTASVLYYVVANLISLLILKSERTGFSGAVLTYIFLISLVGFLFQEALVRIICVCLILIRIFFFELHIKSSDSHANSISDNIGSNGLSYDNFVLSLIVLVLLLYGLKIFTVQTAQRRDALFGQHMTHDLQVSYSSVEFIISHLVSLIDPSNETEDPQTILIRKLSQASSFYAYIKRNFLEFSRYEGGGIGVNRIQEFDLAFELEEIVELYKPLAKDKNINIVLDIDDRLPGLILSDKIKVTRIVLNLLTNAINHTYNGKNITVTVQWDDGTWRLSVANEGAEIPAEQLEQIFKSYDTENALRAKKRLGLGLQITKQLVDALGGTISATSKRDLPTLFTVAIPSRVKLKVAYYSGLGS